MNLKPPTLLRISLLCWLFSLASVLHAQSGQDTVPGPFHARSSDFIVQKDYDELRRSVGRIKPEEIPAIEQKATVGDTQAQLLLGMLYGMGCGIVPQDHPKALAWYHKAADQGSSMAMNQIGIYYDQLDGHDYAEALKWYRKAAEHNDAAAQYNVGSLYESGEGVEQDDLEAAVWYQGAIENGYHEALGRLVSLYDKGKAMPTKSLEDNHKAGLALLQSWANRNNPYAQVKLAVVYGSGSLGLPKDEAQAVDWLRKAAGSAPQAQEYLGRAYSHGRGVPQDKAEAVKWYQKAAEQGDVDGQVDLCSMYQHGNGVSKDLAAAARWCEAAAQQGDVEAQYQLGRMYEGGKGVKKDAVTSIMWFLVAKQGGARDFMTEPHINWGPPAFSFTRHPYDTDYQEALKRATTWWNQHYCH